MYIKINTLNIIMIQFRIGLEDLQNRGRLVALLYANTRRGANLPLFQHDGR